LPGLSVIEAPRSVLGGGVPLMSTLPCRCYAHHPQSVQRNVNRNAGLICNHILSTRAMCFSRRVRLLLIAIAAGVSASVETRKPIYRIHLQRNEYSPICCIGLTLKNYMDKGTSCCSLYCRGISYHMMLARCISIDIRTTVLGILGITYSGMV